MSWNDLERAGILSGVSAFFCRGHFWGIGGKHVRLGQKVLAPCAGRKNGLLGTIVLLSVSFSGNIWKLRENFLSLQRLFIFIVERKVAPVLM